MDVDMQFPVYQFMEVSIQNEEWCNIPEDAILHSHCRENLDSFYTECSVYAVREASM
jgi:hypothetical protein